jgi:ABC-2 type transport system ATP-binding protein
MLTMLLRPMAGSVTAFGVSAAAQPMTVRRMIGYGPQLLSADATLRGRESVELFARLFDMPRQVRGGRGAAALSAMGLTEAAGRLVKTYSLLLPRLAR